MNRLRAPTPRQLELLRAIHQLTREHGLPPTTREAQAAAQITSRRYLARALVALESCGALHRVSALSRSLVLTPRGLELITPQVMQLVEPWTCGRCGSLTFTEHAKAVCMRLMNMRGAA